MNVSDVQKVMETGDGLMEVKIPSTGKDCCFKPMTVGARKSLGKFALSGANNIDEVALNFQISKLALIKTLSTDEDFDVDSLTEVDFLYLIGHIRLFNILDPLIADYVCIHCKEKNSVHVEVEKMLDRCEKYNFKTVVKECKEKDNVWKFVLKEPTIMDIIVLRKYRLSLPAETRDVDYEILRPYLYINDIHFNGEPIEDYRKISFQERIAFLDKLKDRILYSKNGVMAAIVEQFGMSRYNEIFDDVVCDKCGKTVEGALSSDNFFI